MINHIDGHAKLSKLQIVLSPFFESQVPLFNGLQLVYLTEFTC